MTFGAVRSALWYLRYLSMLFLLDLLAIFLRQTISLGSRKTLVAVTRFIVFVELLSIEHYIDNIG